MTLDDDALTARDGDPLTWWAAGDADDWGGLWFYDDPDDGEGER